MQIVSLTEVKKNIKNIFVILFNVFKGMKETRYLLRSQVNKERLLSSLKELREHSDPKI